MTNKEIITQLESIKADSQCHIDINNPNDIWTKDIIALDRAIQVFERKDKNSKNVFMKILFVLNLIIFIVAIIMLYGANGSYQIDIISKQEFIFRILTDVILILLSGTSIISIWRGVGNE